MSQRQILVHILMLLANKHPRILSKQKILDLSQTAAWCVFLTFFFTYLDYRCQSVEAVVGIDDLLAFRQPLDNPPGVIRVARATEHVRCCHSLFGNVD